MMNVWLNAQRVAIRFKLIVPFFVLQCTSLTIPPFFNLGPIVHRGRPLLNTFKGWTSIVCGSSAGSMVLHIAHDPTVQASKYNDNRKHLFESIHGSIGGQKMEEHQQIRKRNVFNEHGHRITKDDSFKRIEAFIRRSPAIITLPLYVNLLIQYSVCIASKYTTTAERQGQWQYTTDFIFEMSGLYTAVVYSIRRKRVSPIS